MKKILLLLVFFVSFYSKAQHLDWVKQMRFGEYDIGNAVALDVYGNVYTTGSFKGEVDFDPGFGTYNLTSPNGSEGIFISKLDNHGNFLWAKHIGANGSDFGNDIEIDLFGNILVSGRFHVTVDFDPGAGLAELTAPFGAYAVFILKLDANGDFIWVKTFEGVQADRIAVETDNVGNVLTSAAFAGIGDFDPGPSVFNLTSGVFISKLDPNGDFLWAKKISAAYNSVNCFTLDKLDNIYISGYYGGVADFDPDTSNSYLTASGNFDAFVLKMDADGHLIWVQSLGEASDKEENYTVTVDSDLNVYCSGTFSGSLNLTPSIGPVTITSVGDFDVLITKYDSTGQLLWVKNVGSTGDDFCNSSITDISGNVFFTSGFMGTIDFDPGPGSYYLTSEGNMGSADAYILMLAPNGDFVRVNKVGGAGQSLFRSIVYNEDGYICLTGGFDHTATFDTINASNTLSTIGMNYYDIFVAKYNVREISGCVFNDLNGNCLNDTNEPGLPNRLAVVNPGALLVQTDAAGIWHLDSLHNGSYTITFDTSGNWSTVCSFPVNFTVVNENSFTYAGDFGLISTAPCAKPEVSIAAPFMRRCFSDQVIYVGACNSTTATDILNNSFVQLKLDTLLVPTSASIPYINIGNNEYQFNTGTLNPGQCAYFNVNTTVSCTAMLGQTLCMEANLFPVDSCSLDTIPAPPLAGSPGTVVPCVLPWDNSDLDVSGSCQNDTVHFTITNTGAGTMQCYQGIRIYTDGLLTHVDSFLLSAGQSVFYSYPGNGQTWTLQADQHPLHPGNSHPTAFVEACSDTSGWTPGLVNNFPLNDADPMVDMYCGVVSGSYDPNDKTGFPTGIGSGNDVTSNQQMQYMIRFQNTGTDTAFTVVVRDTLDTDLDIFTVRSGVSSHNYTFRMYGPRVLEWTFNSILLPDSTTDEPGSHGFVTYTVEQNLNLSNGTQILNYADIYFDFNNPVITNQTVHTINNITYTSPVGIETPSASVASSAKIYPNPTNGKIDITVDKEFSFGTIEITTVLGQTIFNRNIQNESNISLEIPGAEGLYFVSVKDNRGYKSVVKVVKQ